MKDSVAAKTRYCKNTMHSDVLYNNPLGSTPTRKVNVYLPPGYHDGDASYPVIYLLHGYGGDADHPIVQTLARLNEGFSPVARLLFRNALRRVLTYERLDSLIERGSIDPFILVQPDASLHVPHIHERTHGDGAIRMKGSMYVDSPGVGDYARYTFEEVVDYVDANYRTVAQRSARAVAGGSMGGYGALIAAIEYSRTFCVAASMSPSICGLDVLDSDLVVPYMRRLMGTKRSTEIGHEELEDIYNTCDMVFSPDRPLIPTVRRDADGRVIGLDETARANWQRGDAGDLARAKPDGIRTVALRLTCEQSDEYGLADPDLRFHKVLDELNVDHEFELFTDRRAEKVSGHAQGIAIQVVPSFLFCLRHMVW